MPAYLARNSATSSRVLPDDDVLGHDRAGEAAVADRVEHAVGRAPCATLKFGPSTRSRSRDVQSRSPARRRRRACGSPSSARRRARRRAGRSAGCVATSSRRSPASRTPTAPAAATTSAAAMTAATAPCGRGIIREVMTGGRATLLLAALGRPPRGAAAAPTSPYTPRRPTAASRSRLDEYRDRCPQRRRGAAPGGSARRPQHRPPDPQPRRRAVRAPAGRRAGEALRRADQDALPRRDAQTTVDLKPGKYRLVCTIANHDNLGQYARHAEASMR